ncbi:integral membrane protein [Lasius niger]|uniref:Integral membrane protein n=1 Tax=Lasius niger TaxID=67767 RepID=A0A0J7MV45_LASNI|nr:integral membrane protein [Lasius niger]
MQRSPAQRWNWVRPTKRNPPSQGVSNHADGCVAQGELRRVWCLLDTGRPPGGSSQVGIRGSARVRSHDRGTRGIKMSVPDKNSNNLSIVLQGVDTLGDKRPEKDRPDSLGMEPDKAQQQAGKTRDRYSGAARRR